MVTFIKRLINIGDKILCNVNEKHSPACWNINIVPLRLPICDNCFSLLQQAVAYWQTITDELEGNDRESYNNLQP